MISWSQGVFFVMSVIYKGWRSHIMVHPLLKISLSGYNLTPCLMPVFNLVNGSKQPRCVISSCMLGYFSWTYLHIICLHFLLNFIVLTSCPCYFISAAMQNMSQWLLLFMLFNWLNPKGHHFIKWLSIYIFNGKKREVKVLDKCVSAFLNVKRV